ncbi:MAG: transcription antitermination factor NusB [Bacteroidia bacterium]|nr:transcription antitermination factor NusB [Bacteroidia bacterium]
MLNRRLIRIKVFQAVYAYLQDETPSLNKAKSYLENSISGIDHNFYTVLLFPLELTHFIRVNLDPKENKYLPTDADVTAYNNLSFEGLYERIVQNPVVAKHMARPKHPWQDNTSMLRTAYKAIRGAEKFEDFLSQTNPSAEDQQHAFLRIYDYLIHESEEFNQEMEEVEMLWEDEKRPIRKAINTFLKDVFQNPDAKPNRNNSEESDWEFAEELLEKSVRNNEEFETLIAGVAAKWDTDRIAKTDLVIMTMALTELIHFPYIPIKVSLNEYLELAKDYSTPQSSKFVNGILDKLVKQLKAEDRLVKKGRGMVG